MNVGVVRVLSMSRYRVPRVISTEKSPMVLRAHDPLQSFVFVFLSLPKYSYTTSTVPALLHSTTVRSRSLSPQLAMQRGGK